MDRKLEALTITTLLLFASFSIAPAQNSPIQVESNDFPNGGQIPKKFTCAGQDVSPPLSWSGVPSDAKSQVLLIIDPDAPSGPFAHWVLYNLPPNVTSLPEGLPTDEVLPNGAMQGVNDFGHVGFEGPCPPPGKLHHYRIQIFALSSKLDLGQKANAFKVVKAMKGIVIASGQLNGVDVYQ